VVRTAELDGVAVCGGAALVVTRVVAGVVPGGAGGVESGNGSA
jgi:hypothetical protein